jgi:hypothetical protein
MTRLTNKTAVITSEAIAFGTQQKRFEYYLSQELKQPNDSNQRQ